MELLDFNKIEELIAQKYISRQKHPDAELYILNYSQKCQYDRLWTTETLQCRGLIVDGNNNIVARGFKKFFNVEEVSPEEIPNEPFEVFDKLDGSLAILYFVNGKPCIATRGSFTSTQSVEANRILNTKYKHVFHKLNPLWTYLLEIITPSNRIVVDYGDMDDLVLLTAIHNDTGVETLPDVGFPIVKRFDGINDIEQLRGLEEDNKEGFVIKFKDGFRVKMKFAEYVRLHRIVTGVSNVAVWEYLKDGKSFYELLEKVPDEFFRWLNQTKSDLERKFDDLKERAFEAYAECHSFDKKTFALAVIEKYKELSAVLFGIYNAKDYEKIIWKMIRPTWAKPFKTEIES